MPIRLLYTQRPILHRLPTTKTTRQTAIEMGRLCYSIGGLKTNEYVLGTARCPCQTSGTFELLMSAVMRRTFSWFGHVCRHDTLLKIIGLLQETEGPSRRLVAEEDVANRKHFPIPVNTKFCSICRRFAAIPTSSYAT